MPLALTVGMAYLLNRLLRNGPGCHGIRLGETRHDLLGEALHGKQCISVTERAEIEVEDYLANPRVLALFQDLGAAIGVAGHHAALSQLARLEILQFLDDIDEIGD